MFVHILYCPTKMCSSLYWYYTPTTVDRVTSRRVNKSPKSICILRVQYIYFLVRIFSYLFFYTAHTSGIIYGRFVQRAHIGFPHNFSFPVSHRTRPILSLSYVFTHKLQYIILLTICFMCLKIAVRYL